MKLTTLAPNDSAIDFVLSVLKESITKTSSAKFLPIALMQALICFSSLYVGIAIVAYNLKRIGREMLRKEQQDLKKKKQKQRAKQAA